MKKWESRAGRMPINKTQLLVSLTEVAKRRGYDGELHLGLVANKVPELVKSKSDFIYADHAYFNRGWDKGNFRLCRNWIHQTSVFSRKDDRFKKLNVNIEPWRKTGTKVVIIPPSPFQELLAEPKWTSKTEAILESVTDRPILIKWSKGGLREFLSDAWAVVTWSSVAGVEAALMGVPVFASDKCPASPVSAGPVENIESPEYPERHEWACSLAYASWNWEEVDNINFRNYWYDTREAS